MGRAWQLCYLVCATRSPPRFSWKCVKPTANCEVCKYAQLHMSNNPLLSHPSTRGTRAQGTHDVTTTTTTGVWLKRAHFSLSRRFGPQEFCPLVFWCDDRWSNPSGRSCPWLIATVQRSGDVIVGCACTGGTSSLRCRWPWQQPFITAVMLGPCRTTLYRARGLPGQGCGGARWTPRPRSGTPPHPSWSSSAFMTKSPAGRGQTTCLPCPDRKTGYSGPDVLRFFRALSPDPEQVIEVPKILPEDVSLRRAVREQQLVEVPTIVSWSLLQLIMEQNADIPVPGRGGRIAGLQGFLPGQSSTSLLGSQERISSRIVD